MSDQDNDSDIEELDWDDALEDWDELDDDSPAEVKAEPIAAEGARPLYQPPSPNDTFAKRESRPHPATPMMDLGDEEDEEDFESTRIAAIPQELINRLVAAKGNERPTGRPPPPAPAPSASTGSAPPPVDLDLDELLDGYESETRSYPEPVTPYQPKAAAAPKRELPPPRRPAADDGLVTSFDTSEVSEDAALLGLDTEELDALDHSRPDADILGLDLEEPPTRMATAFEDDDEAEELPKTRMVAPLADDEEEELPETAPDEEEVAPAVAKPSLPRPKLPSIPKPGIPRPGAPRPPLPRPGLPRPAIPKPGIPRVGIPKPPRAPTGTKLPRPGLPKPGLAKPGRPKPGLPKPGLPKPGLPKKPGQPTPGLPKPKSGIPAPPPPSGAPPSATTPTPVPQAPEQAAIPTPIPQAPEQAAILTPVPQAPERAEILTPVPQAPERAEILTPVPQAPEQAAIPTPIPQAPERAAIPTPVPQAPEQAAIPTPVPQAPEQAAILTPVPQAPEQAAIPTPVPQALETDADLDDLLSAPPPGLFEDGPAAADDSALFAEPEPVDDSALFAAPEPGEEPEVEHDADAFARALESTGDDEPAMDVEAGADEFVEEDDEDDETEFVIDDEDEDEELLIEAGEDDEEFVIDSDDEEWDEEELAALEAAEEEADAAATDRGALAARRSVRSRKPRDEHFPMVGTDGAALALRRRLLEKLAESREGGLKARVLTAAAELAEQLTDHDGARALYAAALEADPEDVVALRAVRRDALTASDRGTVESLYQREAGLDLSEWELATAWTGLAELRLERGDDDGAEEAALAALEVQPVSMVATLLLAEARWRKGQATEALEAFAAARELWDDPDARAALAIEEARTAESSGDRERAHDLFAWANEVDPEALDGWFGRARTSSRADADPKGAVEALATIAAFAGGALGEAILTRASRLATGLLGDAALGVRLLENASRVVPLQARADAAAATGDRALQVACLEAWSAAAGGTDRALALVQLAEGRAALDDLDGAEAALRDAALADGSLGTIRVVRDVIARRSGDLSRLANAVESGGALAAAARVAQDPASLERERELLDQAIVEGTSLVTADVLSLDVAAAQSDQAGVDAALRRQADRVPPEHRVGSLLAMTERAIDAEDLERAEAHLTEARQATPGNPVILRPLGRLALQRDAATAAAVWLEEASASSGARSAHAATQAGHVLAASDGDAIDAYRRALEASSGYLPAAWALRPLAGAMDDFLTLGEVHDHLAERASHPREKATHLVRGALLRADADPEGAGALLERARTSAPRDAVLQGLIMRLSDSTSAAARAAMLVEASTHAPKDLARVLRLQAAAAFEEADDAASAAEQYRAVGESHPRDPVVQVALDRTEIEAGQVARVAERRFDAVKEASAGEDRIRALEDLATLDLFHRGDPASAALSLQSILEEAPGHLPSLRALQRYYAENGRIGETAEVTRALAENVEDGADVAAHVRLARRLLLKDPEAPGEVADEMLLGVAERAELDLWLAPRVLAAAQARGETASARAAALAIAALLSAPDERASSRLRAAELLEGEPALELRREAAQASPMHPTAPAALAEALSGAGDHQGAAEAWEAAGAATEVHAEAAARFYRAGLLWQDDLSNLERARAAYAKSAEADVTHADVFDRLHGLFEDVGDKGGLADLYAAKLSGGGESAEMAELYMKQANLRAEIGDAAGSKAALRSALALQPERIDALRSLANQCLEDEDWRGAAEVLIRIARVRKEREELRWVFFTLGDIYDQHMPDARRAEAAFKRVLKLFPQDLTAMGRLAQLYERLEQLPQAVEVFTELAQLEVDPDASRTHRLKLADLHEGMGDARKAEATLEEARKTAPTDLVILRAFAAFYERQSASNALTMHLSRAVNDFRHALEAEIGDAVAWPGLVEVLQWNDRHDAATATASAAQALGIVDIELSKIVDARGAAPGAREGAAVKALDELLAPPQLSASARAVFAMAGDALEKALPFDVAAYQAERIDPRDTTIRPIALEAARWFGVGQLNLYRTAAAPRVCVPVHSNPCTILIGSELLAITDDREKLFVLVRALKIAKAQLSMVVRAQPAEVLALMAGLVQSYDPHHEPAGVDPAHIEEAARRIAKNVQRRVRDELGALVFEMAGRPGYAPEKLAMAASEWGNRVALIATGSAPAAVNALAKLSGERELPSDTTARVSMIQRFPEAAGLLRFAISDAHFDARERALGISRG